MRLVLLILICAFTVGAQVPTEAQTGPRAHGSIPSIPGSPSALSACGTVATGNWQLTGNLSAATSEDVCLTMGSGAGARTVDLNGFTITGRIRCSTSNCFNTWITGGVNGTTSTVTCASLETANGGQGPCVWFSNGPSSASGVQLHISDILVQNTVACVAASNRKNMYLDWNWTSGAVAADNPIWVNYTKQIMDSCAGNSNREINVVNADQTLIEYNHITCGNPSGGCGGVEFSNVNAGIVRNNWMVMTTGGGVGRAVIFDNTGGVVTYTFDNEMYENYVQCNDRRCVRIRGSQNARIYDNNFANCSNTSTQGCFDLQESTSGTADFNAIFEGNTINMTGGNAFGVRGSRGTIARNNTFTGSTGRVAKLDTISSINTDFTFQNNTGHTGFSDSTIANAGGGTALITSCPIGTLVVTGTGTNKTHTETDSCVAGGAPLVSLSPSTVAFGSQTVNSPSAGRDITLTNTGDAVLNITGNPALTTGTQFSLTEDCGATLAASAFCTITVTCTPTSVGDKTDSVSVTSNAAGSPHSVSLTCTGITSVAPTTTPTIPAVPIPPLLLGNMPCCYDWKNVLVK